MALTLRLTAEELNKLEEIKTRSCRSTASGAIRYLISEDKTREDYIKDLENELRDISENYLRLVEAFRALKEAEKKLADLIEE